MRPEPKKQATKNQFLLGDEKATQIKASLRSHAAQFDAKTQNILNAFSTIKHSPLEFGARAVLAVLEEIPTGATLPFWMRAVRAIGQELSTGGRRE